MRPKSLVILFVVFLTACTSQAQTLEFSAELLTKAEEHFRRAYLNAYGKQASDETVETEMRKFRKQVQQIPVQLGMQAGKRAKLRDDISAALKAREGIEILKCLRALRNEFNQSEIKKEDVSQIVKSPEPSTTIDGRGLISPTPASISNVLLKTVKAGTHIRFPKGPFIVDSRILADSFRRRPFPDDVTFVGEGKNETTVRINDIDFPNDVANLTFRDLTIHCDDDGLFDFRGGSLTVRMDNVRVIGFDAGHGGCYVFSIDGGMIIHAQDTEFLGGFGRSPGHGRLFRTFPLIGHFQDCRFFGIEYDLFRSTHGAQLWFDDCAFDKPMSTVRNKNVFFENCSFSAANRDAAIREAALAAVSQGPFDGTKAVSGTFILTARKNSAYGTSAFSFRYGSQKRSEHKNHVDLVYQNGMLVVNHHGGMNNAIADVGPAPLDEVKSLPHPMKRDPVMPVEGHTYVQKVSYENLQSLVKFKITSMTEMNLTIDWKMLRDGDKMAAFHNTNVGVAGESGFSRRP